MIWGEQIAHFFWKTKEKYLESPEMATKWIGKIVKFNLLWLLTWGQANVKYINFMDPFKLSLFW